jgi:choline-sulfatase
MPEAANLIFFLTDNHARSMLGCYGHSLVKTPNLDKIAETGVRFDNAYCASSLCCPSRAAIASGLYPHQTGYWDNYFAYDGGYPSWHGRLRDAGRTAVAIGKLHYLSGEIAQGFSDEIVTMHIVKGTGDLVGLLRGTDDGVPERISFRNMYSESGIGKAPYQNYDRDVTERAVEWLKNEAPKHEKPWVLLVSYASPHPPFTVPEQFFNMYPLDKVPMPVQWDDASRPDHPALNHIRRVDCLSEPVDEGFVRRTVAGYCGLVSHIDDQIGKVIDTARDSGLLKSTRLLYTSDHGEAAGNHGMFGKSTLYEHSLGIPLMICGPGVPEGQAVEEIVSNVDLFDTILEGLGCMDEEVNHQRMGSSLWPFIKGEGYPRLGFAEAHVKSTKNAAYMVRDGNMKLIFHVGAATQLFDLRTDPVEAHDLASDPTYTAVIQRLEQELRKIVDPEATNTRAKAEQFAHVQRHGGIDAIRNQQNITMTPPPV